MDDLTGFVVLSLTGRDKGRCFVVLSQEENYVFYADGRTRQASSPKRKKLKHIKKLGKSSVEDISAVTNRQLREAIGKFAKSETEAERTKEE
jgi:ribosomal protein L14E/L6E/L27E